MIRTIRLQHFRSYTDDSFVFGPSVNIILGPNGSGKTNLLESLLVVARGSSYRVQDYDLLQFEADWMRLDALIGDTDKRTIKVVNQPLSSKTYEINDKPYRRLMPQHMLPIVLFEPNHLLLLHGAPEQRRAYLDDILEYINPKFRTFRRNYRRALSQRNSLLKRLSPPSLAELFPWNLRLSELGAVIARARAELVHDIAPGFTELYHQLSNDKTAVTVTYVPQFSLENYETALMQKLEANIAKDIVRGFTAYGPHREDMVVFFAGNPAAEVASRGETRTAVLAFKILELETIRQKMDTTPLLLLDDVFSELDLKRRQALTVRLQAYQTFLTTTDADVILHGNFAGHTVIDRSGRAQKQ